MLHVVDPYCSLRQLKCLPGNQWSIDVVRPIFTSDGLLHTGDEHNRRL
ncbi:Uncharacterized protein APZ42_015487 [Daphnia magna]|uniref:Uncharacterized protein n=1 Tax=Daphnia magna TaxID=35525 RepID=A0A162PIM5_9CRUS|nr:Uncharacterized protein APZ42_015487 [Daphnia magna]